MQCTYPGFVLTSVTTWVDNCVTARMLAADTLTRKYAETSSQFGEVV